MKKIALVVIGFLMVTVFVGIGFGAGNPASEQQFVTATAKITAAQAKDIALQRVPGKIIEDFVIDDGKGNVEYYVFIIKANDGKRMEIMIGAEKGDIISVENYEIEDDPGTSS